MITRDKSRYDAIFNGLKQVNGKITASVAREEMIKSKLCNKELGKIWRLADVNNDGLLDSIEFALAMHLIKIKLDGHNIPNELPPHLKPPSISNGV